MGPSYIVLSYGPLKSHTNTFLMNIHFECVQGERKIGASVDLNKSEGNRDHFIWRHTPVIHVFLNPTTLPNGSMPLTMS